MKQLSLAITILFFTSCYNNSNSKHEHIGVPEENSINSLLSQEAERGKELYNVCLSCHNPALDTMVAPPMLYVQQLYKDSFPKKEAFIKNIVRHIKYPNEKNALMSIAIDKFGLMPAYPFSNKDLSDVASYVYEGNFEDGRLHNHEEMHSEHIHKKKESQAENLLD